MNFRGLCVVQFICVLILTGCASFVEQLGQRTPVPTPIPVPTPVPIATWIAPGIPNDLRITYRYESTGIAPPAYEAVQIGADGSASYVRMFGSPGYGEIEGSRRAGTLSAESLKNVVLAFEERGFFFLEGDRCITDTRLSSAELSGARELQTEAPVVTVSIRINGLSHTVTWTDNCTKVGPDGKYDDPALKNYEDLIGILVRAARELPPLLPTETGAVEPTPTASSAEP